MRTNNQYFMDWYISYLKFTFGDDFSEITGHEYEVQDQWIADSILGVDDES